MSSKAKGAKKAARKRAPAKGPIDLKHTLERSLRGAFPNDTVDVSDGYKGNVHVLVVSRRFDGMSEYQRQSLLRGVIDAGSLTVAQQNKISLLLALSPAEIK
jgi:hypothetical protein